jgi:ectoine hydroxylase-related dioxygenase (phytanoyl-CoA dioxygenase family)
MLHGKAQRQDGQHASAGRPESMKHWRERGFAILRRAVAVDRIDRLNAEAVAICRGERGAVRGLATAAADLDEAAVLRRYLCIQQPHKISQLMLSAMFEPAVVEALETAIGENVKSMQSMLFVKGPGKPGQAWHQDEHYIPTRDRSLCAAWIALDRATRENGCLWLLPGSHRAGVIYPVRPVDDPRFDGSAEAYGFPDDPAQAIAAEVEAGDVVLFHGYLLHRSLDNRSSGSFRRALAVHYMSAESLLPWDDEGRLPATSDMRDIVLVRGNDPYAYKGLAQVVQPYLREAG